MRRLPAKIVKRKSTERPREAILRLLKLRGQMTVAELCKAIGVTATVVRRNLSALQGLFLVDCRLHQSGKGRPSHRYHLTETASGCFPSGYQSFARDMLDTVYESSGHAGVMDFLKLNNDRTISCLRPRFAGKSLEQKVEELVSHFSSIGYMTDWMALPEGKLFLFHQNCAIASLASTYRQLCILEPRLIECLLSVKVSRKKYIMKDQPICGYEIDGKRPLP
jgi:predicted ArsR family transcriptional regulator